ncbi:MAG: response regulator [Puia sp.]|nr:response regulator [Puia sp.]
MNQQLQTAGIIDDDEIYQLVMKRTIEQSGLVKSVLQFYDGEEAIYFFKEKQTSTGMLPEMILLDLNMPYMNGWQFLDEFLKIEFEKDYKLSIFIVTSSSTTEEIDRAKDYSIVSGYHIKPISKDTFAEMVKTVMRAA